MRQRNINDFTVDLALALDIAKSALHDGIFGGHLYQDTGCRNQDGLWSMVVSRRTKDQGPRTLFSL